MLMHLFILFVFMLTNITRGKHSLDALNIIYGEKKIRSDFVSLASLYWYRYFCSKILFTNVGDQVILCFEGLFHLLGLGCASKSRLLHYFFSCLHYNFNSDKGFFSFYSNKSL